MVEKISFNQWQRWQLPFLLAVRQVPESDDEDLEGFDLFRPVEVGP